MLSISYTLRYIAEMLISFIKLSKLEPWFALNESGFFLGRGWRGGGGICI